VTLKLLTDSATIFVGSARKTYKLYKTGSAENHRTSDDQTLKTALIQALNAPDAQKQFQADGSVRFKINTGKGYVVYKTGVSGPDSAAIFHYHWNYTLDLPLTAT
jgi:hypothetical protein